MGQRLAAMTDAALDRLARDSRMKQGARRAAEKELARRAKLDDHCPRGRACSDWRCEKDH